MAPGFVPPAAYQDFYHFIRRILPRPPDAALTGTNQFRIQHYRKEPPHMAKAILNRTDCALKGGGQPSPSCDGSGGIS